MRDFLLCSGHSPGHDDRAKLHSAVGRSRCQFSLSATFIASVEFGAAGTSADRSLKRSSRHVAYASPNRVLSGNRTRRIFADAPAAMQAGHRLTGGIALRNGRSSRATAARLQTGTRFCCGDKLGTRFCLRSVVPPMNTPHGYTLRRGRSKRGYQRLRRCCVLRQLRPPWWQETRPRESDRSIVGGRGAAEPSRSSSHFFFTTP
jgi:hypothetical protein